MSVTMRDIAKVAQVDTSVVSAVLSGSKHIRVSKEKRSHILSLVESMRYRPNMSARSLISRKHYAVGILFYSTKDRFYAEMMAEVQQRLVARGYVGIYAFWKNEQEVFGAYESVLSRGVDGIITCHNDISLFPANMPIVIYGAQHENYDCVLIDCKKAVTEAFDYLTGLGHRKIGFVATDSSDGGRYKYYLECIKRLGLPFRPEWVCPGSGFFEDGYRGAQQILSSSSRPTALIARNDIVGIATIAAARDAGLQVPDDVSVVSFDNIEEARYSQPPLTTAGADIEKQVDCLIEVFFNRLAKPDSPRVKNIIEPELIIRSSCKQPD